MLSHDKARSFFNVARPALPADTIKKNDAAKLTPLQIILWGFVMATLLVLAWRNWSIPEISWIDQPTYIILSKSLVVGERYGLLYSPRVTEATQFPFGLPLLLVPFGYIVPDNLSGYRILPLLATFLSTSILFWGWSRLAPGLSYWWGLAVCALFAISPLTILYSSQVLSEVVFLPIVLGSVWFVERTVERPMRAWGIWLGILAVLLGFVRTVGWLFLAVLLAYLFWRKGRTIWRQLLLAGFVFCIALGLCVETTSLRYSDLLPGEYVSIGTGIVSRGFAGTNNIAENSTAPGMDMEVSPTPSWPKSYLQLVTGAILFHLDISHILPKRMEEWLQRFLDRSGIPFLRYLPGGVVIAFLGLGMAVWYRRVGVRAFQAVVPIYALVLLLWIWISPRFLYPILPQFILALLLAGNALIQFLVCRMANRTHVMRWTNALTGLVILALVLASLWLNLVAKQNYVDMGDPAKRTEWIRQNTLPNAIVASVYPAIDYLYSGRFYSNLPETLSSPEAFETYLREQNVDYILATAGDEAPAERIKVRSKSIAELPSILNALAKRGILTRRYTWAEGDVGIYQVNR